MSRNTSTSSTNLLVLDLIFKVIVVLQLRLDVLDLCNFPQNCLFFGEGHAGGGALEFERPGGGERGGD